MRPFEAASVRCLVVAMAIAIVGACGKMAGTMADKTNGPGFGGETGGGAAGGAGGGDASIDVAPDGGTTDPNAPYGYLCGGDSAACTPGHGDCTAQASTGPTPNTGQDLCKLFPAPGEVQAECVSMTSVGTVGDGEVCSDVSECAPGLGCVQTQAGTSVCRQYCCLQLEACPSQTYCAPQPIAADTFNAPPLEIPVCIPVKPCNLLDGDLCSTDYGAGLMCTIVRADGTTSCVPVGTGTLGEPCPCAPGYVCYPADNTCKKLCHVDSTTDCPGGVCQGGVASYPSGIGVCAGGTTDSAY